VCAAAVQVTLQPAPRLKWLQCSSPMHAQPHAGPASGLQHSAEVQVMPSRRTLQHCKLAVDNQQNGIHCTPCGSGPGARLQHHASCTVGAEQAVATGSKPCSLASKHRSLLFFADLHSC